MVQGVGSGGNVQWSSGGSNPVMQSQIEQIYTKLLSQAEQYEKGAITQAQFATAVQAAGKTFDGYEAQLEKQGVLPNVLDAVDNTLTQLVSGYGTQSEMDTLNALFTQIKTKCPNPGNHHKF